MMKLQLTLKHRFYENKKIFLNYFASKLILLNILQNVAIYLNILSHITVTPRNFLYHRPNQISLK